MASRCPGSLFDFGLFFFHNAKELVARGTGPYFYLPKLESHLEARLWNDVFLHAQATLGRPAGTIRATVLIETILAAFEMDEILWELRDHSAGLNCGRWDYIFSFIKKFAKDPNCVLPDRGTGHDDDAFPAHLQPAVDQDLPSPRRPRHGRHGGADPDQGRPRRQRAGNGQGPGRQGARSRRRSRRHLGRPSGPGSRSPSEIFDREMPQPNQIDRKRQDVHVTAADLLAVPTGTITEAGLRQNLNVGIGYIEAWLRGIGCVPLYNLMEDAATAEISRAQVWQWIRHDARLEDGRTVDAALCRKLLAEELANLRAANRGGGYEKAAELFIELIEAPAFPEFLTLPAYDMIAAGGA